jgi:hypothetical protein
MSDPKWVWFSTHETIQNEVPSVTAILETIIAVPLYWWIALHTGLVLPLLISAAVAPFVLLRSDASVELGLKLILGSNENVGMILFTLIGLLSTGILSYLPLLLIDDPTPVGSLQNLSSLQELILSLSIVSIYSVLSIDLFRILYPYYKCCCENYRGSVSLASWNRGNAKELQTPNRLFFSGAGSGISAGP